MTREFLKSLGITDDSQIDKILDENGRDIGKEKRGTEAANTARTELEAQLAKRDESIKELQKAAGGNESLTKQIAELQEAAKTAKADYDTKIKRAAVKADIGDAVHDIDMYIGLLDLAKVELDENGGIKAGLKEQREAVDKAKPFLLKPKPDGQPPGQPGQPGTPPPTGPQGYKPVDGNQPPATGTAIQQALAAATAAANQAMGIAVTKT